MTIIKLILVFSLLLIQSVYACSFKGLAEDPSTHHFRSPFEGGENIILKSALRRYNRADHLKKRWEDMLDTEKYIDPNVEILLRELDFDKDTLLAHGELEFNRKLDEFYVRHNRPFETRIYLALKVQIGENTFFYRPGIDSTEPFQAARRRADISFLRARISAPEFVALFNEGKIPSLFLHDIFHVFTFLMYPEYYDALRIAYQRQAENNSHALLRRATFVLENFYHFQNESIRSRLSLRGRNLKLRDFIRHHQRSFLRAENREQYLRNLVARLDETIKENIRYINSDNTNPAVAQRSYELQMLATPPYHPFERISYQEAGPILSNIFNTQYFRIDYLLETLVNLSNHDATNFLDNIARVEYMLYRYSSDITKDQMLNDLLVNPEPQRTKTYIFIKEVFGLESAIMHYFYNEDLSL